MLTSRTPFFTFLGVQVKASLVSSLASSPSSLAAVVSKASG